MICSVCRNPIHEGDKVCPLCGNAVGSAIIANKDSIKQLRPAIVDAQMESYKKASKESEKKNITKYVIFGGIIIVFIIVLLVVF